MDMVEEEILDEATESLWVFGYGSLCWNPGFKYSRKHIGRIRGFSRRFYQGNTTHRGIPGYPGRCATLVEDAEDVTYGVAFELEGETALTYLNQREVKLGSYGTAIAIFEATEEEGIEPRGLDFEGDGLACEGLHEDLHTSPKTENEMEGGLLLDVVVGEGPSVLELLASKDQPLLVRGDALLVLDLGLHILDGVRGLDFEGDGLACEGLHEDLHTSPKTEDKVEGGLLLDVVVG